MWLMRVRRLAWTALLLTALIQPTVAVSLSVQAQKDQQVQKGQAVAQPATDPFGRSTPRATLVGFMRAANNNDASAVRYLELPVGQGPGALSLARELRDLINRCLKQPLAKVSDSADGALNDGLPVDRERVGPLIMGETQADIVLVRVTDAEAGPIWLISSETLAQVPSWSESMTQSSTAQSWIEHRMPTVLLSHELLGASVAHWLVLIGSLLVPFALLVLISGIVIRLIRAIQRTSSRPRGLENWYGIRWPLITFLALSIHLICMLIWMRSLGFTLTFRVTYARVALVLEVIALTWLLRKLLSLRLERARRLVLQRDRTGSQSLILLGERVLRAVVVLAGIFAVLAIVGVDTKTALAGLGIGGIALAFGAQRTVENLLGGVLLLSDKVLAIGDFCSIANRVGVVEDITLRSVRLRTLDRTLVSIPAGVLAQAGIENFATREKILAQTLLRLRYGTSVEQVQQILDGIRKLLDESQYVESGSSRIRLINFGAEAIELEIFAYVLTTEYPRFLALREELLLQMASVVEAAGSGFAPTRFIQVWNSQDGASVSMSTRNPGLGSDLRPPQPLAGGASGTR